MGQLTIQETLFKEISNIYPDAIAKKINKDVAMEICIPSLHNNPSYYFVFNTKDKAKINFYFICRDKLLIDDLLRNNDDLSNYFTSGVKPSTISFHEIDKMMTEVSGFIEKIRATINGNTEHFESVKSEIDSHVILNNSLNLKNDSIEKVSSQQPLLLNGAGKKHYDNGNIWQEGNFKDNNLNGEGKTYNEDGILQHEGEFKNGKLNGKGKIYRDNGNIVREGDFEDDKLNGKGKIYRDNGTIWQEGDFLGNDLYGKGKIYHSNGTIYQEGDFKNGKLNGKGKIYRDNGSILQEGYFEDGKLIGKDGIKQEKYTYKSGQSYEGDWKDGERHGFGKWTHPEGVIYEGGWKDDKIHGFGKYTFKSGAIYEGEWKDDKLNGKGKTYYENGNISREGNFLDSELHGNGKKYFKNGSVYEGNWIKGKRNGFGKWTHPEGELYEGEWKDDKKHGLGKYTFESGAIYEGEWKDDIEHGKGKYTFKSGNIYEGDIENGTLIKGNSKVWIEKHSTFRHYSGEFDGFCMKGRGKLNWEADGYKWSYDGIFNGKSETNCWGLVEGNYVMECSHRLSKFKVQNGVSTKTEEKWFTKEDKYKEDASKKDKINIRQFQIDYKIKLTKAITETQARGSVLGTIFGFDKLRTVDKKVKDKGETIQRTIIVKHSGQSLPKNMAKHYVEENDKDVKAGRAGTSTILIIEVTEI